jgi:hypothetical protein
MQMWVFRVADRLPEDWFLLLSPSPQIVLFHLRNELHVKAMTLINIFMTLLINGLSLPNGLQILTDRKSRTKMPSLDHGPLKKGYPLGVSKTNLCIVIK